jgi:hypothetical protein
MLSKQSALNPATNQAFSFKLAEDCLQETSRIVIPRIPGLDLLTTQSKQPQTETQQKLKFYQESYAQPFTDREAFR